MTAKHARSERASKVPPDDSPEATGPGPRPHAPAIERRIERILSEVEDVARSRLWGPALGFTAAWLGLMAVLIGLVTVNDVVTVAGVVAMLALVPALLAAGSRRRREERLRAEIREQERLLEEESPRSPVSRLLDAHLDHMDGRFRLVADHADRGFLVAVAVSGLGFLLVVVGLVLGLRGGGAGRDLAWVGAAAGIAMQAVSAALFWSYSRTLGHLREFDDRLARHQDTLLALHHATELADEEDRDQVLAGLIAAMVRTDRTEAKATGEDWDVLELLRRASS